MHESADDLRTYISVLAEEATDADTAATVASVLDDLDQVRVHLAGAIADVKAHLALVLKGTGASYVELRSGGRAKLGSGKKRSGWRHDELIDAALQTVPSRAELNRTTGEVEPVERTTVRILSEVISFGAGKAKGIAALGRTPDEFCDETSGDLTVDIVR